MKLLVVIPTHKGDAARAEQLIDTIYNLEGRVAKGHCLLVCAPDVHSEMVAKLRLSASLAFETVEVFDQVQVITMTKHEQTMEMLLGTARHIAENYTWPFLWLEPDCLPLVPGWLDKLAAAYENQPRRYLGLRLMSSGGITYLSRTSIYPPDALKDLEYASAMGTPFDQVVVKKSINCRLFQFLSVQEEADREKIRPDALLLHHDKRGLLLDWVVNKRVINPEWEKATHEIDCFTEPTKIHLGPPPRRGRPPKVKPLVPAENGTTAH